MKSFRLLIILLLAFGSLHAQQSHRFSTASPQGFTVTESSTTGLSLHYVLPEIALNDVRYGDMQGQEIVMKNGFAPQAEGLPNLPFENRYIAVPQGATVRMEVREKGTQSLHDIELLPAPPVQRNAAKGQPTLRRDPSVFGQDANFPSQSATLVQSTRIRGLDVVMLQVTPFRYNPVRKQLEVIYDLDIELRFEGGNGQFGDARYRSPEWDGILRNLVINNEMLPESHYYDFLNEALANREEGCEYLIVTTDDSTALYWADTLRRFRQWQGIPTKVVTTAECGHTPDSIRDYVANAYQHWTIPPAAVLMLGGYNMSTQQGLPSFSYMGKDEYYDNYGKYPADNPIVDVNGDSIPDLAISRIAALRPEHYQVQVEKLLHYELNPPTEAQYYDHPIITSGYEDNKWFMITSQSVDGFFRNRLDKHPTNLYMVFSQETEYPVPPDSLWSTDANSASALECFGPQGEDYIPASIGELHDWVYQNDLKRLIQAFNKESFLTLYRDHSSSDTWCCPWFDSNDLSSLENRYPTYLFSIGCLTLHHWTKNNTQYPCLVEGFNRQSAGALGGVGAATITYSRFNDLVTWGMIDYFWPDFMTQLGSHTVPEFAMPSFSLVAGKLFLVQQAFLPYSWYQSRVDATLNYFCCLGETYLSLNTEVPQPLAVNLPPCILETQTAYTLTAEAGAKVCLTKDDEILYVGLGTGTPQTVSLPQLSVGERLMATVTKQNRLRVQQEVKVIPEGIPAVFLRSIEVHDHNGNGLLEEGEPALVDLVLHNLGTVSSDPMTILLESTSPYMEMAPATCPCPALAPDSLITLSEAFRIQVAEVVPDQSEVRIDCHVIHGTDTLTSSYQCLVNAPVVRIDADYRLNDADGLPLTHLVADGDAQLTFSITNTGHAETGPLHADLLLKAPFVTVSNPRLQLESFSPGETQTLTFNVHGDDPEGAWIPAQLEVGCRSHNLRLEDRLQYGAIYEDFEGDSLDAHFDWQNNSSSPWYFSEEAPFEGTRCMRADQEGTSHYASNLVARLADAYRIPYTSKISFYYQDSQSAMYSVTGSAAASLSLAPSAAWKYAELKIPNQFVRATWTMMCDYMQSEAWGKIDHICFPPIPRTVAHAGADRVSCWEAPVVLDEAYAYDCDSIRWVTGGDGRFETDTLGVVTYSPGPQDRVQGGVDLTLQAFSNGLLHSSTMHLTLLEALSWQGDIQGDEVVNKYLTPVSHYAVDGPEGMRYTWQLEPAEAGFVHARNHEIDIVWNANLDDLEAVLSVSHENGCDTEPLVKHIRLVGTWIPEGLALDFNLFPNPTDGQVKLVTEQPLMGNAVVEVFDLLGQRRRLREVSGLDKGTPMLLDLRGLAPGLYIVRMTTAQGRCSKKVSLR